LRQLREQYPELDLLRENLAYLEKRVRQMNYPHFQQQGWPIGYPEVLQIPNYHFQLKFRTNFRNATSLRSNCAGLGGHFGDKKYFLSQNFTHKSSE
jgi:hypothetical protein